MFVNLYSNLMINYGNNTHIITNSEDKFLTYANSYLVESITNEAAMNYRPNTKQFLIKLNDMSQANSINYIVWYTNTAYKHFKVLSCELYKEYAIYSCDNDLWADAAFNNDFINSKIRLMRSNMTYSENNNAIPYIFDSINYTNNDFKLYNFTANDEKTDINNNINLNTISKRYIVAFDREVDSWSTQSILFGSTWQSQLALFNEQDLSSICKLVSADGGDKIRVKAVYILPFLPVVSGNLEVHYKGQPADTHLIIRPLVNATYMTTFKLPASMYDNGNNKLYVGAGDSMLLLENTGPQANINYKFVIDNYGITAYVGQGDNTKDITDAYVLKITSNDATLSLQESLAKITGAGFKAVSGALMLGSTATMVGGLASIAGAGLDLLPSKKPASYTLDGNAISTYIIRDSITSNGFNYKIYKSITDMTAYNGLYGVNYNYFTTISNAATGSLLIVNYRPYIKGISIELSNMSVDEYNFINSELERGIYIHYIN